MSNMSSEEFASTSSRVRACVDDSCFSSLPRQVRQFIEDLFDASATLDKAQYRIDRDTRALDHGHASHDVGIDLDMIIAAHSLIPITKKLHLLQIL